MLPETKTGLISIVGRDYGDQKGSWRLKPFKSNKETLNLTDD